jgi:outer membrane lipoprotein-sorting protein
MLKMNTILFTASVFFTLGSPAMAQQPAQSQPADAAKNVPTVEEILTRSAEAMAKINDYTGRMIKYERFGKEVEKAVMEFKFARPFKVYIKYITPHKGREAIFKRGWNDNEVKVHKGDFPDLTLNLDTHGGTAMDENHHPVTDFGLENTIRISGNNLRKAIKRSEGDFKVTDAGTVLGQPAWKIEARFPKGGYYTTAKDDETLWDIGKRTGQDPYIIMYANKDYDDPDDPDEGDKVFIPRYYGGRSEFIVNKETCMPIKVSTWDWNGLLYESYEYPVLKFNVGLTAKDFDPDNKAYDF